nr:sulfotransferase [uncultured Cohaesibacter sp.]
MLASLEQYGKILVRRPDNQQALEGVDKIRTILRSSPNRPSPALIQQVTSLINAQNYSAAIQQLELLTKQFPQSAQLWRLLAKAAMRVGQLKQAEDAYTKAILIDPDEPDDHFAMSVLYEEEGKLIEAEECLRTAIDLKANFHQAYTNLGTILQKQGGRRTEAIEAYRSAIAIEPRDALAHQYLSQMIKYDEIDTQISQVAAMLKKGDLDATQTCHFHHTMAKMKEDTGQLKEALDHYKAAGHLRQKILGYSFEKDRALFAIIKQAAPAIKSASLKAPKKKAKATPIFILGMPRSGTSLVEQIISSHSDVHGGGELRLLGRHGRKLSLGQQRPDKPALERFRKAYLTDLAKVSASKPFVADKLPQNFLQLGLICSALPEAKIIHTMRDPAATCWSNFKINFQGPFLGYSHDLKSVVDYYKLYRDLMAFWHAQFPGQIYDLDYERLTEEQETETRNLIDYLALGWQDACLSPQHNTRAVKTASVEQVRQQVYRGSSQSWKKFEPYLDGAFDNL